MNFENSKYFLHGLYVQTLHCEHGSEYKKKKKERRGERNGVRAEK